MVKSREVFVLGFALFAMFFGAGNLIFPPLLGVNTGSNWIIPSLGFLFTGVGLPLLGVIAFSKNGSMEAFAAKISPKFNMIYCSILILIIGPFFAVPRTGSTTFELAVLPLLGEMTLISSILTSVIFFGLTYILTIKESSITDIIGQYLTPIILVILAIIFVRGFMVDIGNSVQTNISSNLFSYGFTQGYQTMDALGSILFGIVIIHSLKSKGIVEKQQQQSYLIRAAVIASIGLGVIYVFLIYFGSLLSGSENSSTSSTAVQIAELTLGSLGRTIFGVCVGAACLTTSVGLVALTADWFSRITKFSYKHLVLIVCIFSTLVSIGGLDTIVSSAVPVLLFLYPITIVLIILNLFELKSIYFKFSVYTTTIMALIETLASVLNITALKSIVNFIPLGSAGFVWILPFVVSLLVAFVYDKITSKKVAN